MPNNFNARLKIWGALLLAATLSSCSSSQDTLQNVDSSYHPPASSSIEHSPAEPTPEASGMTEPDLPPVAPSPSQSASSYESEPSQPSVEVSTIQPKPTEPASSRDQTFQSKTPSLAGIKLGTVEKDIVDNKGLPNDTYSLPGDDQNVNIWEYDGYSIGFNDKNKVVYVEINSSDVSTGIQHLRYGMKGSEAAELLGIPTEDQSNVLALEVSGGWLKLDLDPDTQQVLSLKLLSKDI
ncbi:hypothetical protein [Cohnella cholangitidis]|uniref:Uncharacterized protein n=1 Tax=Cohnella cholangitidis TaxID=2598458 RepID=A0A7G5C3X5_9BACL|nr:hypothetical protein [Cohnella cholangitidis]QMV43909.1 hypothetical protein FPL14_24085 [Cohnella cholangitidis]